MTSHSDRIVAALRAALAVATEKPAPHAAQHEHESAIDFMRRMVNAFEFEDEFKLAALPSIAALVEYFDVWSVYGTDFASGVLESIEEGADPAPWRAFLDRHGLSWNRGETPEERAR